MEKKEQNEPITEVKKRRTGSLEEKQKEVKAVKVGSERRKERCMINNNK